MWAASREGSLLEHLDLGPGFRLELADEAGEPVASADGGRKLRGHDGDEGVDVAPGEPARQRPPALKGPVALCPRRDGDERR